MRASLLMIVLLAVLPSCQAAVYSSLAPAPTQALRRLGASIEGLVASLARSQKRQAPQFDPRLSQAAADIVALCNDDAAPGLDLVRDALHLHGLVEPPPHMMLSSFRNGSELELLKELRKILPEALGRGTWRRIGIGSAPSGESRRRLLILLQESFVEMTPPPRSAPIGPAPISIAGQLLPPYQKPRVLATNPEGHVEPLSGLVEGTRFEMALRCLLRGRYQIEVLGEGSHGSTILANFPLYCGQAAPRGLPAQREAAAPAFRDARDAEHQLLALLNAERARSGLDALLWDERLASVARGHSADMRNRNLVAAVSPLTGSPADRVRRASIGTIVLLENLARAYSPHEAHQGIMDSPSVRANVLHRGVTHAGIGVEVVTLPSGGRELWVSQLLMRPAAASPTPDAGAGDVGASAQRPDLQEAQQLMEQGAKLDEAGNYAQAEPLLLRALKIQEEVLGPKHPAVTISLKNLAETYRNQGEYKKAEPLSLRALKIWEEVLGPKHPAVAISLNILAETYRNQGEYKKAEPLSLRALKIQEEVLGPKHPHVAVSLNILAAIYAAQGEYPKAEPLYLRALKIQEEVLGPKHPAVAISMNGLAVLYHAQGEYKKAEPLLLRALKIREEVLGPKHPHVASFMNNLALLYHAKGEYPKAEPLLLRALKIREEVLGPKHPDVAQSLDNLALLYHAQGEYPKAEPLYLRALKIREEVLGPKHPAVAISLGNLAVLYRNQGEYPKAEPLLLRALKIQEEVLGPKHPDVASSMNNLAELYQAQGEYKKAEPLHLRALKIGEEVLGPKHPDVATLLNNLATLYDNQGAYPKAEPLHLRALKIREEVMGPKHPDVAQSLDNLAVLYQAQGEYPKAEPLHLRALKIWEEVLGPKHPDVATSLNNLAVLLAGQGRTREAVPLFRRAFGISESLLREQGTVLPEGRFTRFLFKTGGSLDFVLPSLLLAHRSDAEIRRLALTVVLLRKGRTLQAAADMSWAMAQGLDAAQRGQLERLRGLRSQLATLHLSGPGKLAPARYQQLMANLDQEADGIEEDLARSSAPLRARLRLAGPDEVVQKVAAALPAGTALVEIVHFPRWILGAGKWAELRYLALVLLPNGQSSAVDLGAAVPIDEAVHRLLIALSNPAADFLPAAQALHRLVVAPLRPHLGGLRRLFLAPDGPLNLVPFAALHDGQGFLLDSDDVLYLTSGRDLLRPQEAGARTGSVVVLADPDFAAQPAGAQLPGRATSQRDRSAQVGRLARLPGTRQEAEEIRKLWPKARVLLGAEASEPALLGLRRPGIVHVATHGLFLEDVADPPPSPMAARGLVTVGELGQAGWGQPLAPPNPLLRSMLALAGATRAGQRSPPSGQADAGDGLATALEVAGMDLWGTQLVVLSACETGRGQASTGQGVYGLRRAVMMAGAETLVMSLWRVSDEVTRKLMGGYYGRLVRGEGRAQAMKAAALEVRAQHGHPYYWAPFIVLGNPAPLRP